MDVVLNIMLIILMTQVDTEWIFTLCIHVLGG